MSIPKFPNNDGKTYNNDYETIRKKWVIIDASKNKNKKANQIV